MKGFKQKVVDWLEKEKLDFEEAYIPRGYKRVGNLIVLRNSATIPNYVGEAVLSIFPWCKGVFQQDTTIGENRRPQLKHIAGDANTETIHKENGVLYALDVAKVTFSGGNSELRRRLVKIVKNGENLLDMFAAVGNLSLQPIVHRNIDFILYEKDPVTYSYLVKTLELNNLSTTSAFNEDCRNTELENWADRIFMGYHEVDESHLDTAFRALKSHGFIHLHPLGNIDRISEVVQTYTSMLGNSNKIQANWQKVKKYAPSIYHFEIVLEVHK